MFKKMNIFSKKGGKLMAFLLRKPTARLYGRELARQTGISVGAVNQFLKKFAAARLINSEQRGRMVFYSANLDNPEVQQLKVLLNVSEVTPLVEKIRGYADRVILFGSCAEGLDTEDSDVDLFVLASEKEKVKAELRKTKLTRKITPIILNAVEFAELRKKDKALYDQVIAGKELWRRPS